MATRRRSETADADAVYVYGVVPKHTPPELFADVRGVDPAHPVALLAGDDVAAITSAVPLREFGRDVVEANLRDPAWLGDKVVAHERVLNAALSGPAVLPFRFGAIYDDEEHVRRLLAERGDFAETLSRLEGAYEWGVKGYLDRQAFRDRLARQRGVDEAEASSGRAYMLQRQLERELDEAAVAFGADCADAAHTRLGAAALDARANAAQRGQDAGTDVMFLNGAYLVRRDGDEAFGAELEGLRKEYEAEGVRFERTGPWAPYNFVDNEEAP